MAGFQKATKKQAKARIALDGPSGSGKTWTALTTATALAGGGTIAVIDSERGSASKYADRFEFDVLELDGNFHPDRYMEGIRQAAEAGYSVVVIDSLTHAWAGSGGVLEVVDAAKSRFSGNSYMAWSVGTPLWQALIDAMLGAPVHIIATMRSKTKFVEDDSAGKKSYKRAGTETVARDGVEYEFDVVGDLDLDHTMVVSKTRAGDRLKDVYRRPGPEFGEAVLAWLTDGAVNTDALARELLAIVGPEGKAELGKEMKAAGISAADLADADKLAKARSLADGIKALASAPAPEPDENKSAGAVRPPAEGGPDMPPEGAVEPGGVEATSPGSPLITEKDRRQMLAKGADWGYSKEDVNEIVLDVTGQPSTKAVTVDQFPEVIARIEEMGSAKAAKAAAA